MVRLDQRLGNLWPNSSGRFSELGRILTDSLNELPTQMKRLAEQSGTFSQLEPSTLDAVFKTRNIAGEDALATLFNHYKSDKANEHKYHLIYANLFSGINEVKLIVEIGIGSNNEKIVSNMGRLHSGTGGSLRAFRDFFLNAQVVGLDIDKGAFFEETRIKCGYFNQTGNSELLDAIGVKEGTVDLFIDDGLHLLGANLMGLSHGLRSCRVGGWIVIEDLTNESVNAWLPVVAMLRLGGHWAELVETPGRFALIVRKQK